MKHVEILTLLYKLKDGALCVQQSLMQPKTTTLAET